MSSQPIYADVISETAGVIRFMEPITTRHPTHGGERVAQEAVRLTASFMLERLRTHADTLIEDEGLDDPYLVTVWSFMHGWANEMQNAISTEFPT